MATLVVAGCDAESPRLYPGMPRLYKVVAPSYELGSSSTDHLGNVHVPLQIEPGVAFLFSPPVGFRAIRTSGRIEWTQRHSTDEARLFIAVEAGYPLDTLNAPCRLVRNDRELQRNVIARGVSALCDAGNGERRVVVLRKTVNWAVGCTMDFWPRNLAERDALALCETMQVVGVSEFTDADREEASRNSGDGP